MGPAQRSLVLHRHHDIQNPIQLVLMPDSSLKEKSGWASLASFAAAVKAGKSASKSTGNFVR